MGNARWDATDWGTYATAHVTGKPAAAVFTSRDLKDAYNPAKIEFRESRDSAMNPLSTPIILGSDVTGSMGMIAHTLMRDGLNTLATGIYDRKPVTDPHIMVLAIGDAECDRAPLQATQFEADIRLADQVRDLWIEGGGGGNSGESYSAAHLFAALKTRTDAAEKRGRKGYLFTIGDEPNLDGMRADQIKRVFGETEARDLTARDCLAMAERTILLEDVSKLAETVISTIQVTEGANVADVAASWSGSTAVVVANALRGLPARAAGTGLRRL